MESARLPKGTPFSVPEGYFQELTHEILRKTDVLASDQIAARPHPFRVPDGYFDTLTTTILERSTTSGKIVSIQHQTVRRVSWWAAAAVLVFGLILFRTLTRPVVLEHPQTATVSLEELQASYLVDDLDETVLTEALAELPLNDNEENEALHDYLIENGTDLSQIDIEL